MAQHFKSMLTAFKEYSLLTIDSLVISNLKPSKSVKQMPQIERSLKNCEVLTKHQLKKLSIVQIADSTPFSSRVWRILLKHNKESLSEL